MTIRLIAAGAVFVMASTAGAFAADFAIAPAQEPIYASNTAYNWTGFYAGVSGGFGWGTIEGDIPGSLVFDTDGFVGGVQAGVNYDLGGLVLGLEADINAGELTNVNVNGLTTTTRKLDYFGTVRARVGYAYDRFLPYVTAGVIYGRADYTVDVAGIGVMLDETKDHVGWTIGAGAEYAMTDNLTVRAEYLYGDLGTRDYTNGVFGAQVPVRVTAQTARIGLNYKF